MCVWRAGILCWNHTWITKVHLPFSRSYAALQTCATNLAMLFVGRLILGGGIGFANQVGTLLVGTGHDPSEAFLVHVFRVQFRVVVVGLRVIVEGCYSLPGFWSGSERS